MKAVFIPKPKGTERWQLYDLATDPGEVRDLAEEQPEVLKEMLALWDRYVLENGVIPLQPELGEYVEALEGQMTVSRAGWSTSSGTLAALRTQTSLSAIPLDSRPSGRRTPNQRYKPRLLWPRVYCSLIACAWRSYITCIASHRIGQNQS
jgi:hypothetical protein